MKYINTTNDTFGYIYEDLREEKQQRTFNIGDFDNDFKQFDLPEEIILALKEMVKPVIVYEYQKLEEHFIRTLVFNHNYVDWTNIFRYQTLSEKMIKDLLKKFNSEEPSINMKKKIWSLIFRYQKLPEEVLNEFAEQCANMIGWSLMFWDLTIINQELSGDFIDNWIQIIKENNLFSAIIENQIITLEFLDNNWYYFDENTKALVVQKYWIPKLFAESHNITFSKVYRKRITIGQKPKSIKSIQHFATEDSDFYNKLSEKL